jgi:ipoprotein LpqH
VVKRGFLVAIGGAAIVIAGLSGCSSEEKSESPAAGTAATGSGETKVTIDGQDRDVQGSIVCSTMGGNMNIAIGEPAGGVVAVVSSGDSPTVQSVALGSLNNVALGYQAGAGQAEAKAEKDGNTYKISGTATGIDMANPLQPVNKPFEIEVTCP